MIVGMVALTMFVVSTQAASVAWSTGDVSTLAVNAGQTYATDWQNQMVGFYLVAADFDLAGLTTQLAAGNDTTFKTMSPDVSFALGSKQAAGNGVKVFNNGDSAYGFAIVYNKNADLNNVNIADFAISKTLKSGTFAAGIDLPINFGGNTGFKTYDVVPEPTSMALLALGVAAIGLRRRFKK